MKRVKRSFWSLLLSLALLLAISPAIAFASTDGSSNTPTLNYVALGDSVAAGYLNSSTPPNYQVGDGYPVLITKFLNEQAGIPVKLTNYSVGGNTTDGLLKQLETDTVKTGVKNANFITIDIGANDLLNQLGTTFDPKDPTLVTKATDAMKGVQTNLVLALNMIKQLNPNAPIFIMGYYNALPYKDGQQLVVNLVNSLNQVIAGVAGNYKAIYVPTFDAFNGHYQDYLPNQNNIHPNEAGYQAIASEFIKKIVSAYSIVVTPGVATPVSANQRVAIAGSHTVITMPGDLPVGTTLKVTDASKDGVVTSAKDFELAGEAFTFNFTYPSGTSPTAPSILVMNYNKDKYSGSEVAVYNYNNDKKAWEMQNGTVNEAAGTVTVAAYQSSTYAVFTKEDNSSKDNTGNANIGTKDNHTTGSHNSVEEGGQLPNTATNSPLFIMIGCLITASGVVLLSRKKKASN